MLFYDNGWKQLYAAQASDIEREWQDAQGWTSGESFPEYVQRMEKERTKRDYASTISDNH